MRRIGELTGNDYLKSLSDEKFLAEHTCNNRSPYKKLSCTFRVRSKHCPYHLKKKVCKYCSDNEHHDSFVKKLEKITASFDEQLLQSKPFKLARHYKETTNGRSIQKRAGLLSSSSLVTVQEAIKIMLPEFRANVHHFYMWAIFDFWHFLTLHLGRKHTEKLITYLQLKKD